MPSPQEKLPASITISSFRNARREEDRAMEITITDRISGCFVVKLSILPAALMEALSGVGNVHCTADYGAVQRIGQIREVCTAVVTLPYHYTPEDVSAALASSRADGWIPRESDIGNSHCRLKGDGDLRHVSYGVSMTRFRDSDEAGRAKRAAELMEDGL